MDVGFPPIFLPSRPTDDGHWIHPFVTPLHPQGSDTGQLPLAFGTGIPIRTGTEAWKPDHVPRDQDGETATTMQLSYGGYEGRWLGVWRLQ